MCIRDSLRQACARGARCERGRAHQLARRDALLAHLPERSLSLIHISEPTETVLDIVCRLLLEKKKNKHLLAMDTHYDTEHE